jgi:hypothetical protein
MTINGQYGGGFKAAGSMSQRAGYCRLDVPACRPAGSLRDRMVMPDGLVRNQRSEPTVAAVC